MRDYSRDFRAKAVRRILAGEKVAAISRELGVHRKLLYEWTRRVKEGGEASLRERGRPRKIEATTGPADNPTRRIAELERSIAQQQLIIEFFRHALLRVEESRHTTNGIGATASSESLRQ